MPHKFHLAEYSSFYADWTILKFYTRFFKQIWYNPKKYIFKFEFSIYDYLIQWVYIIHIYRFWFIIILELSVCPVIFFRYFGVHTVSTWPIKLCHKSLIWPNIPLYVDWIILKSYTRFFKIKIFQKDMI